VTKTAAAVAEANASIVRDVRKALYAEANLGTEDVEYVRVAEAETSTGAPESAAEGRATAVIKIEIHFTEDIGD